MNTRTLNKLSALLVFLISLITYTLCLEPSVSWWDCGEFISSAYRLEVGHPPGAPLFMLIGRAFSLFAHAPDQVAYLVNMVSVVASAGTVLFLYLTIVMLMQKISKNDQPNPGQVSVPAIVAGIIGSLVYAFSDTFWFSAVEGEVYALSSLFTAVVFWAILRWEREADHPGNLRWILFIAFMVGLSIGVHLLNLLAIPAIVLLWYYRKYPEPTRKGTLIALAGSLAILAVIMYVLIPGVVVLASWFELFFVNLIRLPYNSGLTIYILLLIAVLVWCIRETHQRKSVLWNTILLSLTLLLIGYSSYSILLIRSSANPPMDQNNPDNVISLIGYLNREQYGARPLISGPSYNAPVTGQKPGKAVYGKVDGRYKIVDRSVTPVYDKRFITLFPRMWSSSPDHVQLYKEWAQVRGQSKDQPPTFTENLRFFFSYQLGHMYFRYFMWNFVGRQNDTESQGGIRNGNWLSGIGFVDNARLGPQKSLPDQERRDKSRNTYYFLPLLLGLAGAIYQYRRSPKDFKAVMLLFIFTGIAIVVYLNQYPNQPRERDYSYAGSFYAFAVWVGVGAGAIVRGALRGKVPAFAGMTRGRGAMLSIVGAILVMVPVVMAVENWDDHNRSGRYIARDFAYNYLNSCAPGAILFTNGDNDTFPLWYAQEVEGIRTDVRVICLPYLAADWYIDQLKRKAWLSDPVPFSLTRDQYGPGKRDYIPVVEQIKDTMDLARLVDFVTSDKEGAQLPLQGGGSVNYIPGRKLRLAVDRQKVLGTNTVPPEDAGRIVPEIIWEIRRSSLYKNDLMILDLIAHNNWERPIYFTSIGHENILGLDSYFRLEGFAYRFVPVKEPVSSGLTGSINTGILYERLMNTFRWGNISDQSVFIDSNTYRTSLILRIRQRFADLADALIREGKSDSARLVLDRVVELLPPENFRNDVPTAGLAEMYFKAGKPEKGDMLLLGYLKDIDQNIRYINSVERKFGNILSDEKQNDRSLMVEIRRLADGYKRDQLVIAIDKLMTQQQSESR